MDAAPELEFDFLLAERLGMTVADMRARMSNEEYLNWGVYLGRQAQRRQVASV